MDMNEREMIVKALHQLRTAREAHWATLDRLRAEYPNPLDVDRWVFTLPHIAEAITILDRVLAPREDPPFNND